MSVYLVKIQMFAYEESNVDTKAETNVYSSFEKAKEEGLIELKSKIKIAEDYFKMSFDELLELEKLDYCFEITKIDDLDYAENFQVKYNSLEDENYLKLEPTHIVYYLDYKGNIKYMNYEVLQFSKKIQKREQVRNLKLEIL